MIAYLDKYDTTVEVPDDIGDKDLADLNENFVHYNNPVSPAPEVSQPIEKQYPNLPPELIKRVATNLRDNPEPAQPAPAPQWHPNFYESVLKHSVNDILAPAKAIGNLTESPEAQAFAGKVLEEGTFGLAKPIIGPALEETYKDHPAFANAGRLTGGIGSLMEVGGALRILGLGGRAAEAGKAVVEAGPEVEKAIQALGIGEKGAAWVGKAFAAGERFVPRAIMSGCTFGTRTFIADTVKAFRDGGVNLEQFGKDVLKDTAFGGIFGTIGGVTNGAASVASAGGLGFISSKMDGADNREASLNAAIWGAFEAVGSFGKNEELRMEALGHLKDSIGEYASERNPGLNEKDAQRAASQFVDQAISKAGFKNAEEIAKSGPENLLEGIEKLNQMVRNAKVPAQPPAPEPKLAEIAPPAAPETAPGTPPAEPAPSPLDKAIGFIKGLFTKPAEPSEAIGTEVSAAKKPYDETMADLKAQGQDITKIPPEQVPEDLKDVQHHEIAREGKTELAKAVTETSNALALHGLTDKESAAVLDHFGITKTDALGQPTTARQLPLMMATPIEDQYKSAYQALGGELKEGAKPDAKIMDKAVAAVDAINGYFNPKSQEIRDFAAQHKDLSDHDVAQMAYDRGLIEEPNRDLLEAEIKKAKNEKTFTPMLAQEGPEGSKTGAPHGLFAYNSNLNPEGEMRSMYTLYGDPEHPLMKELAQGSKNFRTTQTLDWFKKRGIPITGREPRSVNWEPLDAEVGLARGPQGQPPTGQALPGQPGKTPLSEEAVHTVFPGPEDPSLKSITSDPSYVNMRRKAADIVHRYANDRGVAATPELAQQMFTELHDALGDVRNAKPEDRVKVAKEIMAKFPKLEDDFVTLKDQLYSDKTPPYFDKFIKGQSYLEPQAGPPAVKTSYSFAQGSAGTLPRPAAPKPPMSQAPEEVASRLKEAGEEIRNIVDPSKAAPLAAQITRETLGKMARSYDIAEATLADAKQFFDSQPQEANLAFIDKLERGLPQAKPTDEAIAKNLRTLLDNKRKEIQALGTGKMQSFIENYFPHIWDQGEKQVGQAAMKGAKRPFEGSKSFMKKRSIEFTKDGIEMGLTPVSYNPVDLALLKIREMDKYLMAHRTIEEYKKNGLAKYVKVGGETPEGWTKIDDRISTVFKSPMVAVQEAFDEKVMNDLNAVAKSLGIDLERSERHKAEGQRFKDAWGLSMSQEPSKPGKIWTKFAGPESALAHEIGHQIDNIYGLQKKFLSDPKIAAELSELANQRIRDVAFAKESDKKEFEGEGLAKSANAFRSYVQKPDEKMAVMLESYIHAPELLKETAPNTFAKLNEFLKSVPKLEPLTEIKPSLVLGTAKGEVYAGGNVIAGNIYAQPDAARIINNYLSPGLQKSAIFQAYRWAGNMINQFQLSMSLFHLGFTSVDASVSKFALALHELMAGNPMSAVKNTLQVPFAPVENILRGDKLLKAWRGQGQSSIDNVLAETMASAGGRARMDQFYATSAYDQLKHDFEAGRPLQGILRIPFAAVELSSKPILEWIVPRQKLGIFADMMKMEMENHPEMTHEEVRAIAQKAWDSVDNRMGQLVYDNLFWNRTFKDLLMASVRSVGWNLGTVRELAGGGADYAENLAKLIRGKDPEFTYRMSYVAALPILVGMMGAIVQYLRTGKGPQELKDYFFPKTGGLDAAGDAHRVTLPSYMKDVYHYAESPVGTVTAKLSPILSMMAQMMQNKDYYGEKIRNEDDPLVRQVASEAAYILKQVTPFSIRNMQKNLETQNKSLFDTVGPWVGITPAPYDIDQTKAEKLAHEIAASHQPIGARTHEQVERSRLVSDLTRQYKRGDPAAVDNLLKAYQEGRISHRQMQNVIIHSSMTPLQRMANGFSVEETQRIYNSASDAEKGQLDRILMKKKATQASEFVAPSAN